MKARTFFQNGDNIYEIYFTYESYYGGTLYRSYQEMVDDNEIPNCEAKYGTLVGWIHSFLYGVHERIDIMYLDGKPTIEEVEAFMNNCVEVLHNPNKISREIANKLKGF